VRVAIRPENVRFDPQAGQPNRFTARVTARRYQGAQTIYDLAVFGTRIEALEMGTSARYEVDTDVDIVLPPDCCWAYGETADPLLAA